MTVSVAAPPAEDRRARGVTPSRRAVVRWAWRLFRREWRQQLLVLALIVVAVTGTIVGSAVATNTPPPATSGFGTAQDAATFAGTDPRLAPEIAALEHRFGAVDVIENKTLKVPGSVDTYQFRAQNPSGPYGQHGIALGLAFRGLVQVPDHRFPRYGRQVRPGPGAMACALAGNAGSRRR